MKNKELRYLSSPVNLVERMEGEKESRTVEGYAAKFNSMSKTLGWFQEIIDIRAFDDSDMGDVVALFNHNNDQPLARTSNQSLDLEVDSVGLKFRFNVPDTNYGNDLMNNIKSGLISECSFAFSVEEEVWDDSEKISVRTIKKISKLFDVSPVTRPAYNDTGVAARSFEHFKENKNKHMVELDHLERELILKGKI